MRRIVLIVFFVCALCPLSTKGQDQKGEGWQVPDLKGLVAFSISISRVDGVEKIVEKFRTSKGGLVARISGNGRVFAYAVDRDEDPPIDYLLLDPDGSGRFSLKFGPDAAYLIPEWVSR